MEIGVTKDTRSGHTKAADRLRGAAFSALSKKPSIGIADVAKAAAAARASGSALDDSMELGGSPRRTNSWSNSPALQHYVPDIGLIRPPALGPMELLEPESTLLSPRDELRQRLLSVDTAEISPMHARSPEQFQKEAVFESLDYNLVDSNLQILAQRAVPSSRKAPQRRKITLMRWILTILIGIATGTVASFINFGVQHLNALKYRLTMSQVNEALTASPDDLAAHFLKPCLVFVALNVVYVLVATLLVSFVEPVARGSGIPEVKCYLNGVSVPRVVRFKTLACKAVGVLFSVAGGLPVGKEGPMIHSGAVVGAGVSQGRQLQQLWSYFGFDPTGIADLFNAFRNDHEKRDFVACGTAAGVAAAFGAPIGGALFALEEGATHWNDFLTWRSFVSAMVSGFTLEIWMSVFNAYSLKDQTIFLNRRGSITFGTFTGQDGAYAAKEVPLFILLGVCGGLVGAGFNALNERLTVWRKANVAKHGLRNVLEALFVALTVALIGFVIPYLSITHYENSCVSKIKFEEPGKPGGVEIQSFSTFYCPDAAGSEDLDQFEAGSEDSDHSEGSEQVNYYALLFFQPSEDTIKMLFHSEQSFSLLSLAVFSSCYFILACWTYGIAVPSGLFVPSLLLGAAFGRLYGEMLHMLGLPSLSQAGVYALIGSAAMLGGMARMTISITVIMIEATNDYTYGLPLMLTLMTARWVGNSFNEGLYDIHIHLNQDILTAAGIMSPCVPDQHQIEEVEKVTDVIALLRRSKANAFFVTEPNKGAFSGIILRKQLCQLLKDGAYTKVGVLSDPVKWDDTVNTYPKYPTLQEAEYAMTTRKDFGVAIQNAQLDVGPFMSPTPYTIRAEATLSRVMHLFQGLGLRHLPVIDSRNNVIGMITRKDITHHALDEALLRLHAQSSGPNVGPTVGTKDAAPSAAVQRLVSLESESALAATQRTRSNSLTSSPDTSDPRLGRELDDVTSRVGFE